MKVEFTKDKNAVILKVEITEGVAIEKNLTKEETLAIYSHLKTLMMSFR